MCLGGEKLIQYEHLMNHLIALFSGKDMSLLTELKRKMHEASVRCHFEKAMELRDTITAVKSLLKKEEMMEFAKQKVSIGMFDRTCKGNVKFFYIKRNTIYFHAEMDKRSISVQKIVKGIEKVSPAVLKASKDPLFPDKKTSMKQPLFTPI